MIYTEGSKVVVNEVYMGRTPEIQKFYDNFSKLRNKYIDTIKTPNDAEYKTIEKHIEKIFGFSIVHFEISPSQSVNAFTYPVAGNIFMDTDKYIRTTRNGGYKYDKEAQVSVLIYIYMPWNV